MLALRATRGGAAGQQRGGCSGVVVVLPGA
jgi:hypothetical protein